MTYMNLRSKSKLVNEVFQDYYEPTQRVERRIECQMLIILIVVVCTHCVVDKWYGWDKCTMIREEEVLLRREKALSNAISGIQEQFPNQDPRLWSKIFSALATISDCNSECPRVLLFLVERGVINEATNCLITEVANKTAPILPFEEQAPLAFEGKQFDQEDTEDLRKKVMRHGLVLMKYLERISSESAETLHFFCDEHDKNFAKALYLLTLTVESLQGHATHVAEKALRDLWNGKIKEQNLDALITRLTGQVIVLKPEKKLPCVS